MNSRPVIVTAAAAVFVIAGTLPVLAGGPGGFIGSNPNSVATNLYRSGVVACQIDGFRGGSPAFKNCLRGYLKARAREHRDNADRLIEKSRPGAGHCLDRTRYRLTRCADA